MPTYTSTTNVAGLLPGDYGALLIEPIQTASVALNAFVSTVITTASHQFHVPIVNADAGASWVAEGQEIAVTDPSISELVITPAKVGGLTVISRELADDSSPAAAQIVGDGLARSIAQQIDLAYFGNLSAPAPAGLGSLANSALNRVVAGVTPSDLDSFAEAMSLVELDGAQLTAFVAHPTDALAITTIKSGSALSTPLLGVDATNGTSRQILGVPLLTSPRITPGVIWGLSAARNIVVLREDVSVVSDSSAFFTSDRIAVKATLRVGFGFPTAKAVVKIALAAS